MSSKPWRPHGWQSCDALAGAASAAHVLSEFYVNVTQKLRPELDRATARADVRALFAWQPIALNDEVFDEAGTFRIVTN